MREVKKYSPLFRRNHNTDMAVTCHGAESNRLQRLPLKRGSARVAHCRVLSDDMCLLVLKRIHKSESDNDDEILIVLFALSLQQGFECYDQQGFAEGQQVWVAQNILERPHSTLLLSVCRTTAHLNTRISIPRTAASNTHSFAHAHKHTPI